MVAWKVYFHGLPVRHGGVIAAHHCPILRGNGSRPHWGWTEVVRRGFRSICSAPCSRA